MMNQQSPSNQLQSQYQQSNQSIPVMVMIGIKPMRCMVHGVSSSTTCAPCPADQRSAHWAHRTEQERRNLRSGRVGGNAATVAVAGEDWLWQMDRRKSMGMQSASACNA